MTKHYLQLDPADIPEHLRGKLPVESQPDHGAGKFEPKLEFDQRCAVLAALLAGFSRRVVGAHFGIHSRTVTHIANPTGRWYHNVRQKRSELGDRAFMNTYLNGDTLNALVALKNNEMPQESHPSGGSRKYEGFTLVEVKGDTGTVQHRIEIKYVKAYSELDDKGEQYPSVTGWYFKDHDFGYSMNKDGDPTIPILWTSNDDGMPFDTSAKALQYVKENVFDARLLGQ